MYVQARNTLAVQTFENDFTSFSPFQAQEGWGGGKGGRTGIWWGWGGGGGDCIQDLLTIVCIQLPRSLSHIEFCALIIGWGTCKKRREGVWGGVECGGQVATLLLPTKVILFFWPTKDLVHFL